jgi:hypothetical protein
LRQTNRESEITEESERTKNERERKNKERTNEQRMSEQKNEKTIETNEGDYKRMQL